MSVARSREASPSEAAYEAVSLGCVVSVCCIAIFALAFRLAAPPSGLPVNHNGLLGAAGANQLFPRLSQEREKWLTAIIILSAPLAFGGVSFLRGFLNDALRLRPLGNG